jgi:hypothetical protein
MDMVHKLLITKSMSFTLQLFTWLWVHYQQTITVLILEGTKNLNQLYYLINYLHSTMEKVTEILINHNIQCQEVNRNPQTVTRREKQEKSQKPTKRNEKWKLISTSDAHRGRADSGWPARHAYLRFLPSNSF